MFCAMSGKFTANTCILKIFHKMLIVSESPLSASMDNELFQK